MPSLDARRAPPPPPACPLLACTVEVVAVVAGFLCVADVLRARNVCRLWRSVTETVALSPLAARFLSPLPALEEQIELAFPSRVLAMAFNAASEELYVCSATSEGEILLFTHDATRSVRAVDEFAVDMRGLPCSVGFQGVFFVAHRRTDGLLIVLDCRRKRLVNVAEIAPGGAVELVACSADGEVGCVLHSGGRMTLFAPGAPTAPPLLCGANAGMWGEGGTGAEAEALWCSTDAIVIATSTPHRRGVLTLRAFSLCSTHAGASIALEPAGSLALEGAAAGDGHPVAFLDGGLWLCAVMEPDSATVDLLVWRCCALPSSSPSHPQPFERLPIAGLESFGVSACMQLHACVPGQVVGCLLRTRDGQQLMAFVSTRDASLARVFVLPHPAIAAFHPRVALAVIAEERPRHDTADSEVFAAFRAGLGLLITLAEAMPAPAADAKAVAVQRVSTLYWWGGLASYAVIIIALGWTVAALIYNGWLGHMQRLFGHL